MKSKIPAAAASLALLASLTSSARAQGCWQEVVVASPVQGASSVFAGDVDGDGDVDVLSAGYDDDTIAWHENLGGDGSSWSQHVISTAVDGPLSVSAADLDGDGDLDVLSTSIEDEEVNWYENVAGDGSQWVEHLLWSEPGAIYVMNLHPADIDGDGDVDVVRASVHLAESLVWYENAAGDASTWKRNEIKPPFGSSVRDAITSDLDGDGDADVLAAASLVGAPALYWFENVAGDGSSWVAHTIEVTGDCSGFFAIAAVDVDGDGDEDVVSSFTCMLLAGMFWWENTSGDGTAWTRRDVMIDYLAKSAFAADMDGDGDLDVASWTSLWDPSWDDRILWHENDSGDGSAWSLHEVTLHTDGIVKLLGADIDGDGDVDPLSASATNHEVAWYENELPDPLVTRYCSPAVPNSSGEAATICATGSSVVSNNDLTVHAAAMPPNQFGYFLTSETQGFVSNPGGSTGNLCLGGTIGRFRQQIQSSGDTGTFALLVDLTNLPFNPPQTVVPGDKWNFQAWFRDVGGTSNFTDAIEVEFE